MSPDGRRSRWSRWSGARDAAPGSSTRPSDPPLDDDLVQDVVTMTRQAAVDGLPLSSVLEDLRLVLDLEPGEELPAPVLRECALAWAAVHQDLAAGSAGDVAVRTWHELESHLWGSVGLGDHPDPTWLVEVRAGVPRAAGHDGSSVLGSVLRPADHLRGAAQVLATFLDRPGELVSLLREPAGQEPDRVVALVVTPPEDRPSVARARLGAQPIGGEGALDVRVVPLTDHPEGMLPALREAVEQPR